MHLSGDFWIEFWIQLIVYLVTFSFFGGIIWQRLKHIEHKQDKYNELIERMYEVEYENKKAEDRLDDLENEEGD